mgnify:CR=1 FL=1
MNTTRQIKTFAAAIHTPIHQLEADKIIIPASYYPHYGDPELLHIQTSIGPNTALVDFKKLCVGLANGEDYTVDFVNTANTLQLLAHLTNLHAGLDKQEIDTHSTHARNIIKESFSNKDFYVRITSSCEASMDTVRRVAIHFFNEHSGVTEWEQAAIANKESYLTLATKLFDSGETNLSEETLATHIENLFCVDGQFCTGIRIACDPQEGAMYGQIYNVTHGAIPKDDPVVCLLNDGILDVFSSE